MKIEVSSYSRLYSVYVCQIKDTIGTRMIGDLTTRDIQQFIDERAVPRNPEIKPLSHTGLQRILHLLSPCFRKAVEEEIIYKNPCDYVQLPKDTFLQVKKKEQFSMTPEELMLFQKGALEKNRNNDEYKSRSLFLKIALKQSPEFGS